MDHPLDNPAWHALQAEQHQFGLHNGAAARYRPEISPIAALGSPTIGAYDQLAELTGVGEIVAAFATDTNPGAAWEVLADVALTQWTCATLIEPPDRDVVWVDLDAGAKEQMYALAKAADPGPFEMDTHLLGDYVGVFDDDRLIAMAGERICFAGFREVSAVSTLAGYEGRGLARTLVAEITRRQIARDALPFLHVRIGSPAEAGARRVYENLGFVLRAEFTMNILRRV